MAKDKERSKAFTPEDEITFNMVDKATVIRLQRKGEVDLPRKKVNVPKDERWNTKLMNSKLLQGILNGDSVPTISKSLMSVIGNNEASAVRNARTMITGAENAGRIDSYNDLDEQGVVQKKVWIATADDRTRESHLDMDGEEVDIDEPFSNGLMYPADPSGDPSEVWNCRCSMRTHIVGFRKADGSIRPIGVDRDETSHGKRIAEERKLRDAADVKKKQGVTKTAVSSNNSIERMQNSIMDSYEYHRIHNDLNATPLDEMDKEFFGVQLTKMDDELKDTISDQFSKLASKYDTTVQNIKPMDKMEYLAHKDAFATTYHDYTVDSSTIMYNPVKITDVDRIKELIDSGYATQINKEFADRYVITHEFAHTLIDMGTELNNKTNWLGADYKRIESVRKEINGVYDRYMAELGKLDKEQKAVELEALTTMDEKAWKRAAELSEELSEKSLGRYSMVNSDEFMAECFAHHELGGAQNDYVDEIMEIINRNYGR